MCLTPLRILNRSKYVDFKHGSNMYYNVPCGCCEECLQDRQNAFLARAYAEWQFTNEHKGLAFVDCLTYNDDYLPMWRDGLFYRNNGQKFDQEHCYDGLPVFSSKDICNFFKRLRMLLDRAGFYLPQTIEVYKDGQLIQKEKHIVPLKHLCTMEYGGQWHRPHYHILFFFLLPISPEKFDELVRRAWHPFGMTDSYKKDGSLKLPKDKVINANGAIAYVSKYCIKQDDFYNWFVKFCCARELCRKGLIELGTIDSYSDIPLPDFKTKREVYAYAREILGDKLFRAVTPKVYLSNNFGASLIHKYDIQDGEMKLNRDYIYTFETGLVNIYAKKDGKLSISNTIKLPQYNKRKLFYKSIKDFDSTNHWELNDDGMDFTLSRVNKRIELLATRYQRIYDNLPNYIFRFDDLNKSVEATRNKILGLLNGRGLSDFATYIAIYKGRLFDNFDFPDLYDLSVKDKRIYSDNDVYQSHRISLSFEDFNSEVLDKFNKNTDKKFALFSQNTTFVEKYYLFLNHLEKKFLVDEKSHYLFHDFDKLYQLFLHLENDRNKIKQHEYQVAREAQEKAKLLDPRYRQHEFNNQAHRDSLKSHFLYKHKDFEIV